MLRGARPFLRTLNWSTPALILYFCFRRYLQAKHIVQPVMWVLLSANLVNLAGDWVLVFGNGAPTAGGHGRGVVHLHIENLHGCGSGDGLVAKGWRGYLPRTERWKPDFARIWNLLRIGCRRPDAQGKSVSLRW